MTKRILFDIITNSPEETESAGEKLAGMIGENKFVAMYGDLGAGKTAFVRGFVRRLVPDAQVCSPTYSIINEYTSDKNKICHIDAYRISDDDDLYSCGFYDYSDWLILAEWSENIAFAVPADHVEVRITQLDENRRDVCVSLVTENCP